MLGATGEAAMQLSLLLVAECQKNNDGSKSLVSSPENRHFMHDAQ
jgi:hypothetical protein